VAESAGKDIKLGGGVLPDALTGAKFDILLAHYLQAIGERSVEVLPDGKGVYVHRTEEKRELGNKWLAALDGIKPLKHVFKFRKKYSSEDEWPHPYQKQDFRGEVWDEIIKFHGVTNFIGFSVHMPQVITAWRLSVGWKESEKLIGLQMMRGYIRDVHGDKEPYKLWKDGSRTIGIDRDTMAPTRCLVMMQYAMWEAVFANILDPKLLFEVASFLVDDPMYNTMLMKTPLGAFRDAAFCMSTNGIKLVWTNPGDTAFPVLQACWVARVTASDAETEYFEMNKEGLAKHEASMMNGYVDKGERRASPTPILAKTLRASLSWSINPENILKMGLISSFVAWSGFTRTDRFISHINQVKHKLDDDFIMPKMHESMTDAYDRGVKAGVASPKLGTFGSALRQEMKESLEYALDKNLIPTWKEYSDTFMFSVNSRSAGGRFLEYAVARERGPARTFKVMDKRSIIMSMAQDLLSVEELTVPYTKKDPGLMGSRSVVGGKPVRAIDMRDVGHFILEGPIARPIMLYQQAEGDDPGDRMNRYTVGKETGIKHIDHAWSLWSTSTPDVYARCADQSKFDAHQHMENVRRPMLEAAVDVFTRRGLYSDYGPFPGGIVELVQHLWGPGIASDAWYEVRGDRGQKDFVVLDSLQSGELITNAQDSLVNLALFADFNSTISLDRRVSGKMQLRRNYVLGDDSIEFWQMINPGDTAYRIEILNAMQDAAVESSNRNGFEMHKEKSVFRRRKAEYTKVHMVCGMNMPVILVQPIASERASQVEYVVNWMSSWVSTIATCVTRGMDHDLMTRFVHFIWMFRRALKVRIPGRRAQDWYYLPYGSM